MTITTGQLTVGTTRQQIDTSSNSNFKIIIHNRSASDNLFIGDSAVTADVGLELHNHSYVTFELSPGDELFVISSSGTHDLAWMKIT
jgi:hypothetical protein